MRQTWPCRERQQVQHEMQPQEWTRHMQSARRKQRLNTPRRARERSHPSMATAQASAPTASSGSCRNPPSSTRRILMLLPLPRPPPSPPRTTATLPRQRSLAAQMQTAETPAMMPRKRIRGCRALLHMRGVHPWRAPPPGARGAAMATRTGRRSRKLRTDFRCCRGSSGCCMTALRALASKAACREAGREVATWWWRPAQMERKGTGGGAKGEERDMRRRRVFRFPAQMERRRRVSIALRGLGRVCLGGVRCLGRRARVAVRLRCGRAR